MKCLLLSVFFFAATSGSAQYAVQHHVIGNGATVSQSTGARLTGTCGQSVIGRMQTPAHQIGGGFWFQERSRIPLFYPDFDGNGATDALTDGLLILRYLFGFRGSALVDSIVDLNTCGCTVGQIETTLASHQRSLLDADGNANVDALTDGVLILRRLFGLAGDELVSGAVAHNCQRCSAAQIQAFVDRHRLP